MNQIKFEHSERVFLPGQKRACHPIQPKAFFSLVSFTRKPLVCSVTGFNSSLLALLKVLNIFPFTTVQVGVYKIWTSNLSTGGSWNFRTSSKGGYGLDILIPYFGGVILFSLLY